jgi:pimeloyl-ACP methyl ester carboxylesterase
MNLAAQRALIEGIAALEPLFEALPLSIRDGALAMVRSFDPASVAATTRFLASGSQPFAQLAELAQLSVPTLIIAGRDPEHPAEVADLYAATLPSSVLAPADEEHVTSILAFLSADR